MKFVVVGSTVVELELRRRRFEDDIDLFVFEPSPLVEEDQYLAIAEEEGWQVSYTVLGTPKFVVKMPSGEEAIVEFYENIHDYYIPLPMLERAGSKKIRGVSVKLLQLEDYVVLKAKAARETDIEDLRIIKELVDEGKLKMDQRRIRSGLETLPEEDRRIAESKLRDVGLLR